MTNAQGNNLFSHSGFYRTYCDYNNEVFDTDSCHLNVLTPIGITRELCIDLLRCAMDDTLTFPCLEQYSLCQIVLACSYFDLELILENIIQFCFSDMGLHHLPMLTLSLVELYGFSHPLVHLLKCKLSNLWHVVRLADFPKVTDIQTTILTLPEDDFWSRFLFVFTDIVISPWYNNIHSTFICTRCLCIVRPTREACVTLCCHRPAHLECYLQHPCFGCWMNLAESIFRQQGRLNIDHNPEFGPMRPLFPNPRRYSVRVPGRILQRRHANAPGFFR